MSYFDFDIDDFDIDKPSQKYKKGYCYECQYWTSFSHSSTRDYGCGIWEQVENLASTPRGHGIPTEDNRVCSKFRLKSSKEMICCRCSHWSSFSNSALVDYGCSIWAKVEKSMDEESSYYLSRRYGNDNEAFCSMFK